MQSIERAGFAGFRESHGYVVQHFVESERTVTELAARMEVTQQAASKVVAELIGIGILEAARGEDRRSKRMRLSADGRRLVRSTRRARKRIEARLIDGVGAEAYAAAKPVLLQCLETLGGLDKIRGRRVRAPR